MRVSVQIIVVFGNKSHTLLSFMHNLYHNAAAAKDVKYLLLLGWFAGSTDTDQRIKAGCGVTDAQEVIDSGGSASSEKIGVAS